MLLIVAGNAITRGLCKVHYARFIRSGSVHTRAGSPRILMDVVNHVLENYGSSCVHWPFALDRHGYGQIMHAGKCWRVHRFMLTLFPGQPANDKLEAVNACGVSTCFNPTHLYGQLDNKTNAISGIGELRLLVKIIRIIN